MGERWQVLAVRDYPAEERPVNRLREVGTDGVSTVELLACVLQSRYAVHTAEQLLAGFDGLDGLARAEEVQLEQVHGVGPGLAARLRAVFELGRRVQVEHSPNMVRIRRPDSAAQVLIPMLAHREQEGFVVLYLNTRNMVFDRELLYKGSVNMSLVRVAEIFRGAVRRNAMSIVVGHNHPSGDARPSPEDIALTRRLVEAGKLMEVDVLDHIIVGRYGEYRSLREHGEGYTEL